MRDARFSKKQVTETEEAQLRQTDKEDQNDSKQLEEYGTTSLTEQQHSTLEKRI